MKKENQINSLSFCCYTLFRLSKLRNKKEFISQLWLYRWVSTVYISTAYCITAWMMIPFPSLILFFLVEFWFFCFLPLTDCRPYATNIVTLFASSLMCSFSCLFDSFKNIFFFSQRIQSIVHSFHCSRVDFNNVINIFFVPRSLLASIQLERAWNAFLFFIVTV